MPRSRKRTTSKASWTSVTLESAINTIRNEGISVNKAAQQYQIPYSTLKKRYRLAITDDSSYSRSPTLGRKPVFTSEQEQILVKHILDMSNIFYGLTSIQLRKICYNMAVNYGLENRFNTEKKSAGKDWLYGFMNRHPELSIRKPEATSINRILGFNKTEVTRFFSNLESVMTKFNFEAQNIFNMDETGFSTVHEPDNIIALKGRKRVGAATSWETKPRKSSRNKQHSEVLTSTPMKEVFEEKKEKKNKREKKINKPKKIQISKSKNKIQFKNKLSQKNIHRVTRNLFQDSTTDESSMNEKNICDDDSEYSEEENVCMICNDVGKNEELWYRCRACGKWAHSECSGYDHPEDYICNFCLDP
nr:unnamed protein product [Amyelois transitella]